MNVRTPSSCTMWLSVGVVAVVFSASVAHSQDQFGGGQVAPGTLEPRDGSKELRTVTLDANRFVAEFAPPRKTMQRLVVDITGPPLAGIKIGQAYPLRLQFQWEGALPGEKGLRGAAGSFEVGSVGNLGISTDPFAIITPNKAGRGSLELDPPEATATWEAKIVFKRLPKSPVDFIRLNLYWRPSDRYDPFLQPYLKWSYAATQEVTCRIEPLFAGPGTTLDVGVFSLWNMDDATVSFGDGITLAGKTRQIKDIGGKNELWCPIRIAPDAKLGPRHVEVTLPDGRREVAVFTVRPLVILLIVDACRPEFLYKLIESGSGAPHLARHLGKLLPATEASGLRATLFERGLLLHDVTTAFPSYTFPCNATIVTGCEPGVHEVAGSEMLDRLGQTEGKPAAYGFDRYKADIPRVYSPITPFLADKALRAPTIYEAMAGRPGLGKSAVFYHMYGRGVDREQRWIPGGIDAGNYSSDLFGYLPGTHIKTPGIDVKSLVPKIDMMAMTEGCGWLQRFANKDPGEWPSLVTIYFSALDHMGHVLDEPQEVKQKDYLTRILDAGIARLADTQLRQCPGAVIVLVADHGQTDVQGKTPIALFQTLATLGYKATQDMADSNVMVGHNGGVGHVYVRSGDQGNWQQMPPRDAVLKVAESLWQANEGQIAGLGPRPYFDLVLVKNAQANGWDAPYRVYQGNNNVEEIAAYLRRTRNAFGVRLGWKNTEEDILYLRDRLNVLSCARSGDLIVLPHYPEYYIEDGGSCFGEHGSLFKSDMLIPLVVFQPGALGLDRITEGPKGGEWLAQVVRRGIENPRYPRVTDVTPTVAAFLGQNYRGRQHPNQGGDSAPPDTGGQQPAGPIISEVSGTVQVKLPGEEWKPATEGMKLPAQAEIRTGKDGQLTVKMPVAGRDQDAHDVEVRNLTQLLLDMALQDGRVISAKALLKLGEVAARVVSASDGTRRFSVESPLATVTVQHTHFAVRHQIDPEAVTTVFDWDGSVLVTPTNRALQPVTLQPGQQVQIRAAGITPVQDGKIPPFDDDVQLTDPIAVPLSQGPAFWAGSRSVLQGETTWLPVSAFQVRDLASLNVELGYNAAALRAEGARSLPAVSHMLFESNTNEAGIVRLGWAGQRGMTGDSQVAAVGFRAVGSPGQRVPVRLQVTESKDSSGTPISLTTVDGLILIVANRPWSALDAIQALKMSVGLLPEERDLDVNADGVVTSRDAAVILQLAKRRREQ